MLVLISFFQYRFVASPELASQPVQPVNLAYLTNHQRFSPTKAYDAETKFSSKPLNFPDSNRNGSLSLASTNNQFLKNYHPSSANTLR